MNDAHWIAVDWGTTNLRCWLLNQDNQVIAERKSDQGGGKLKPKEFEAVLISQIEEWLNDRCTQIIACGMVGSKEGWRPVPYKSIPGLPYDNLTRVATLDSRIDLYICAGMAQSEPAAIMRGEETQLAGFLSVYPNYEGAVCLPGTHSKWTMIHSSKVVKLESMLTGELYALLREHSILSATLDPDSWCQYTFEKTLNEINTGQLNLLPELFRIRANAILKGDHTKATSRLSALLIGSELLAAREFWASNPISIIGSQQISMHYLRALQILNADVSLENGDELTLKGLIENYKQLTGKEHEPT